MTHTGERPGNTETSEVPKTSEVFSIQHRVIIHPGGYMCDTLFAAAGITRDNRTLFAKNSDRPPNEAQHLSWFPAQKYKKGT